MAHRLLALWRGWRAAARRLLLLVQSLLLAKLCPAILKPDLHGQRHTIKSKEHSLKPTVTDHCKATVTKMHYGI